MGILWIPPFQWESFSFNSCSSISCPFPTWLKVPLSRSDDPSISFAVQSRGFIGAFFLGRFFVSTNSCFDLLIEGQPFRSFYFSLSIFLLPLNFQFGVRAGFSFFRCDSKKDSVQKPAGPFGVSPAHLFSFEGVSPSKIPVRSFPLWCLLVRILQADSQTPLLGPCFPLSSSSWTEVFSQGFFQLFVFVSSMYSNTSSRS